MKSRTALRLVVEGADKNTEKLMLVLRDGRKLMGVLRSWDQFGMDILQVRNSMRKEWS